LFQADDDDVRVFIHLSVTPIFNLYIQYVPTPRANRKRRVVPVVENPRPLQRIRNHSPIPFEPAEVSTEAASQPLFMLDESSDDDEGTNVPLTLRTRTQLDNQLDEYHIKQWQTSIQANRNVVLETTPFISAPTLQSFVTFLIRIVKSHAIGAPFPNNPEGGSASHINNLNAFFLQTPTFRV
jgi:hypothetical protein